LRGNAVKDPKTIGVYVPLDRAGFLPLTRDEYAKESQMIKGLGLIQDAQARANAMETFIDGVCLRYGIKPTPQIKLALAQWVLLLSKS
jgi:hypothetical protein